jgi:hypothetical protein
MKNKKSGNNKSALEKAEDVLFLLLELSFGFLLLLIYYDAIVIYL